MIKLIIFLSSFYLLLLSTIGYGFIFQKICLNSIQNKEKQNLIYIGFYGLFCLTFIAMFTSFFYPHNFIHNFIIHFFGLFFLIFCKIKNKKIYLRNIFLISIFLISALLISKTHDDFSYYHLPITKYLTEHKIIFGTGNLTHGYKLISSLFFLNSIYYIPYIEYFSFHFSLLFFLIFFNFFLLKEIISKNTDEYIKYIYLIIFVFFNLSFNRLAEYGTDKVGQLLIVVSIIKILEFTCIRGKKIDLSNILILIPLIALCITLKTYFLPYLLLGLFLFLINEKYFEVIKTIFVSKSFLFFMGSLTIFFIHHFVSTGCIISPLSATCFGDNLDWAYEKSHYKGLSEWLEQWAKAGAGPNFRVESPGEYIKNFNWLPRWFEFYFFLKVKDQILILISTFIVIFLLFKKFKIKSNYSPLNKNILFFYSVIIIIFLIWFTSHPQLRYGGYSISFLTLSIPFTILLNKFENKNFFNKRFIFLVIFVVTIFNFKNFMRIGNELQRTDYFKYENFPFFSVPKKKYVFDITNSGLLIYKTNGHCWDVPSPCVQSIDAPMLKTIKKNGYYFIIKD